MKRWSLRLIPLLVIAPFIMAAAPAGDGARIEHFFLVFVAMLLAAKVFGELAERIGQPAVLGELIAGVILGGSVLAFEAGRLPDQSEVVAALRSPRSTIVGASTGGDA